MKPQRMSPIKVENLQMIPACIHPKGLTPVSAGAPVSTITAKSKLNPNAKPFVLNPKAKEFVPSAKRPPLGQTPPQIKLGDLPVEVLLNVFIFLELPDLNRCGQVSKRLRSISLVQSLWQTVILLNDTWNSDCPEKTTMSINLVERILDRGCTTLSLQRCRLKGTYSRYFFDGGLSKNLIKKIRISGSSQLINLDLYQCDFTNGSLETLLLSCHSLKKLSLTEYNINIFPLSILRTFYSQNGQSLQILNLAFTHVLDGEHIKLIVKNCVGLKEVDFSDCCLSDHCIRLLVKGITKNVEKIGLALSSSVSDHSIAILVSRCNKIKSLNLAFNYISDNSLIIIKQHLKDTLEELDVTGCWSITDTKLLEMRSMPKLKVLNYFKKRVRDRNCNYEVLNKYLPQLTNINPLEKWKTWHISTSDSFFERRKWLFHE